MACKANLTAKHAISSYLGGATDASLCCNHSVLAYFYIVCNLHQIVKFYSFADCGCSEGGPVDGGIGTYFYMVFNDNIACLRYFFVLIICLRRKPKAIAANNCACMDDTIGANYSSCVNFCPA